MPLRISMQFDDGVEKYDRVLDKIIDNIKDLSGLWRDFIATLEAPKGPINEIFASKGGVIGSDWTNDPIYEKWKSAHFSEMNAVDTGLGYTEQVLSGLQYAALVSSSAPGAIREVQPRSLVYGLQNEYSAAQQKNKRILDFYPGMIRAFDRTIARWWQGIDPVEIKG